MRKYGKRIAAAVFCFAFMLTLAGCGGNQKDTAEPSSEKETTLEAAAGTELPADEDTSLKNTADNGSANKINAASPTAAKAGDIVVFGAYEQDRDFSNGLEPIEWLVLDRDGDTLLLVSRYILDSQPYELSGDNISWEDCTLRTWLNGVFYNTAFLPEEKDSIVLSDVGADPNPQEDTDPGNNTQDKVYLLSIAETERYLPSEEDRTCEPSEYAKAMGVLYMLSDSFGTWWLRTPGNGKSYAAFYDINSINYAGKLVDHDDYGVRPALRVNAAALETARQAAGIDVSQRRIQPETEEGSIDMASLQTAEAGSVVFFGTYEQDNDMENGNEPIEWIVLEKDGTKLLLLSKYSLDNHPFKGASSGSVWSSSTLRGWMNNEFFCEAFTRAEQACIQTSHVTAEPNPQYGKVDPGADTEDQVFLLSISEAEKYLPDDADRVCLTTAYAGAKAERAGVFTNTAALSWWLRTPGMNGNNVAYVKGSTGALEYDGTMPGSHNGVVRPSIWIDTDN